MRGRGAGLNPGNRFEDVRLHVLGEHLDEIATQDDDGVQVKTRVVRDASRTVINPVDSPDLAFDWTINPYRGCEHGCIYCYARPGHEYLSLSCGLDFETVILAKHDAPTLLRRELMKESWKGETIMMSGVTDPYQPVERALRITRGCLEVCAEFRQPVSLITKNRLILRDLDILLKLHEHGAVRCAVSLTTLDASLASKMEPRASSPGARLETIRVLASHGIPVTVMTAPIIPRINDHELPALLAAAAQAGASGAGYILLRLPHQIKALFLECSPGTSRSVRRCGSAHPRQPRRGSLRINALRPPARAGRLRGADRRHVQTLREKARAGQAALQMHGHALPAAGSANGALGIAALFRTRAWWGSP